MLSRRTHDRQNGRAGAPSSSRAVTTTSATPQDLDTAIQSATRRDRQRHASNLVHAAEPVALFDLAAAEWPDDRAGDGCSLTGRGDLRELRPIVDTFVESTPLFYYILKEAEVIEDGERLGTVGACMIAEVFIGLLQADPSSSELTDTIRDTGGFPNGGFSDLRSSRSNQSRAIAQDGSRQRCG